MNEGLSVQELASAKATSCLATTPPCILSSELGEAKQA
jgi:hypothetical protein